ncbi:MAG: hypothetical protein LBU58_08810 [Clostridiales bacterium]|jgi:cellobiose phosphorylase|nr:hypothetical protein [Clostridiales bacterium]
MDEALMSAELAARRFIERYEDLIARVGALSVAMSFAPLYVKKKRLFSIGYNLDENTLVDSFYDLLASEARQTSYISIARGEVPPSHWFKMGRALTVVDRYKGLVSWTGTMFEYLMPNLIMKSYKNTLLDETYSFVIKSQKKYGKQRGIPWGTSESGFNSLDVNLDYRYKAIGVPWLGLKRGLIEDAVVAPYAVFLALPSDPEGAILNLAQMRRDGLDGPYGFYEAADYTPERMYFKQKRAIVKSFMAHHQGMSLLAIDNFLNGNVMQRRFHADPAMNAARLLLQERVPANIIITKENKEKVLPFKQEISRERIPTRRFGSPGGAVAQNALPGAAASAAPLVRSAQLVRSMSLAQSIPGIPNAHILSNGKYSIVITDRGTGYSKNKTIRVSRWREDSTLDPYGMFFYLRNIDTNDVWSAAFAPLLTAPDRYEAVFTPDKAVFTRADGQIETKTEIIAAPRDNVEIRRLTLKNLAQKPCSVEVTSYFEPVLTTYADDIAHPAFSNLFVETSWIAERHCVCANRRPRSEREKGVWLGNAVVFNGDMEGDVQFETDRMRFLGRGRTCLDPVAMEGGRPLSNTAGAVLDPAMSLRARVRIKPGQSAVLSFVALIGESDESLLSLLEQYADPGAIAAAFRLEQAKSQMETWFLNLKASEIELYQNMVSHMMFLSPTRAKYREQIQRNGRGQPALWRYGISGDLPILFLTLKKAGQDKLLYQALKAHEYWRMLDFSADLVVLCDEGYSYALPLYTLISDIVESNQARGASDKRGGVFILERNKMPPEDIDLLYAASRLILDGDAGTAEEQVNAPKAGRNAAAKLPPQTLLPESSGSVGSPGDTGGLENLKSSGPSGGPRSYAPPAEKEPRLRRFNGLGGFGKDGDEYVVVLEKGRSTPAPWSNVIANPKFGFLATEAGSGFTWAQNSHEFKLTPWSNDAVSDAPGEAFYLTDADTGEFWTPTALPVREDEPYTIRHGFGYSVFVHASHGIEQTLTQYVPIDESVKLSRLLLKNRSPKKRSLTLTYYIRPVLGVSESATAAQIKTRLSPAGALLFENAYNEDFAGQVCFMDVSTDERTLTCDRGEFFGGGTMSAPGCLGREGLSGAVGVGFDPCGAIRATLTLAPNASAETVFALGVAADARQADALAGRYCGRRTGHGAEREAEYEADRSPGSLDPPGSPDATRHAASQRAVPQAAEESLREVRRFWKAKLGAVTVQTPTDSMNLILNGWLSYQAISCRLWARSAFYQSGGAFGFRDQLQDCLSVAVSSPEIARAQILLHAGRQFAEGDVQHWWHEPQGNGTRTRFSDDRLWLPYATAEYIRITGDRGILAESMPFLEGEGLAELENERYAKAECAGEAYTLYEHCVRAIDISLATGAHGLPLMGAGDWNDGMNTVGNGGLGESVWLGWFLVTTLGLFARVCEDMGETERAKAYASARQALTCAIEENAWDGDWYRRAYFDDGTPLGSLQAADCKIDSIAQSWAVLSGAGDPGRARQAMKSMEDYLVSREDGIIKLLTPPFSEGETEPGYIKSYLPGIRENGGQYTHAAVWAIIAFAKMGEGDKAWELFKLINPISHTGDRVSCARYKAEPYVLAADVYAVHPNIGRGGWSWYTGAAGWMYRAGLEHILGFCKKGGTVLMDPCIPRAWKGYSINYLYMDTAYNVSVLNPEGRSRGVRSVRVDGAPTAGGGFSLVNDKKTHEVEVLMG